MRFMTLDLVPILLLFMTVDGSAFAAARESNEDCPVTFTAPASSGPFDPTAYEQFIVGGSLTEPVVLERTNPKLPKFDSAVFLAPLIFEVFIASTGEVDAVYIARGKDSPYAAHFAGSLFHWRFQPGTRNGQPVPTRYVMTVRF